MGLERGLVGVWGRRATDQGSRWAGHGPRDKVGGSRAKGQDQKGTDHGPRITDRGFLDALLKILGVRVFFVFFFSKMA
jgi:hypothetical protein